MKPITKECSVVMLPTDGVTSLNPMLLKGYNTNTLYFTKVYEEVQKKEAVQPQHLYITTDDKMEIGDWYIFDNKYLVMNDGKSRFEKDNYFYAGELSCRKIITSTVPQLTKKGIAKIPESFIKSYIEKPVDKVMVEYEKGN